MSDSYNLKITDFLTRFRANKKIDDLFSRGYTLGMDSQTNQRIILKLYSIQTPEQEQAVLENLQNFAKLNQINGISKLLSFAIAENNNELMSAFEYDPMTLGEFTQVTRDLFQMIKQSNMTRAERFLIYWEILAEISKIINTSIQIGIQLDDINRETVLIKKNNTYPQSSSSLMELENYVVRFFYDQRQKQYTKIQNNILTLQNNNKLYWSPEKIQTQILRNSDYTMQEGEQSIYQLGLMFLDIVYEIQKYFDKNFPQVAHQRQQQELKPDEEVLHSESMMSYYLIDKNRKIVQRNQPLITQRLNYLISLDGDCYKQLGLLLKNMTMLMSQARPSVEKIQSERMKIVSILSLSLPQKPAPLSSGSPKIQNSNHITSFKSLQSISEQPIQSSIGQTIKNIEYSKNNISSAEINQNLVHDFDSLKYSENSLGNNVNNQIFYLTNEFVKKNNYEMENGSHNGSPSPIAYRKEIGNQKSATTVTSEVLTNKLMGTNGYEAIKIVQYQQSPPSNNDSLKNQSPILSSNAKNALSFEEKQNRFIKTEQLLEYCQMHHENLKTSLISAIKQLEQIRKMYSEKVLKKQYFDGSVYYGCFDSITKKKKGLGIYVYNTGDIYFGNWDQNLLINGTYLFKNGESFQGIVKAGKQGLGIYRYSNGNVYQGMWKDDLKNGKGVMKYPNGARYDGQWMKGKKHGQGIYYYQNGTKYQGGFALGKKYGNGIFIFTNGTRIEGFWDNNHLEGLAKIYYQNGDYYEGNFHMSQKSGEGVYRWNNQQEGQIQYRGSFKKDNLDGFAIIKFRNGEIYEGKVKNGKRDGQGIYKYSNGDQFKGEWKNDQKQIGKYIFSTGDQFQGRFKQGQMSFGLMKYLNGQTYQGQFYRGERHGVGAYSTKVGQLVYEGYWEKDEYKGNKKN